MDDGKPHLAQHVELARVDTALTADVDVSEVTNLRKAHNQLFSDGRPRWQVAKENKNAMLIILILLVSHFFSYHLSP